jgi:hypothetical protein
MSPSAEKAFMTETCRKPGVSRRSVLLAAAGAAPLLALTGGEAQAKLAMTAVKYQTDPKDGKQCDGCNFFVAPNSCKMVDGDIAATGWCLLWVKKPAT